MILIFYLELLIIAGDEVFAPGNVTTHPRLFASLKRNVGLRICRNYNKIN